MDPSSAPKPPKPPKPLLSISPPPPSMSGSAMRNPKVVAFQGGNEEVVNESSPLIRPGAAGDDGMYKMSSPIDDDYDWDGEEEETKSSLYLFLLTLGGLGLQIAWSVETSNGSPYLLSLGLSKSVLALVWIAGPLSGMLVQPYVGMKSDNCRISWGKRRPFIVGGAVATIVSLMVLAWAKEIVTGTLGLFGLDSESWGVRVTVMVFAVLFVYVLDFAINVIQAAIRTYIVDCAPTHQQESANAWMIRASGVGNIMGYLAGNIKLPKYLPWLGGTQFKVLSAIASFILGVTVAISCFSCGERDPTYDAEVEDDEGVFAFFKSLSRSIKKLPPQISRVCQVQFFAWIGWFPFLFYITTYVGQIYVNPKLKANPNMTDAEIDKVWEDATRVGTRALLIFAITTFTTSIFLPFIIPPTYEAPQAEPAPMTPTTPRTPGGSRSAGDYFGHKPAVARTPRTPGTMTPGGNYHSLKGAYDRRNAPKNLLEKFYTYLDMLQIKSLTLRRSWFISHIMFAVLMGLTFIVRDTMTATILVALIGIPWTLTNWAPFAIISSEISKSDAMRRGLIRPTSHDMGLLGADEDDSADQAGVILGIHNVAIAAPQVIATLVSSVIFKALQKPRGIAGDDSVAWVLRFGGICAIIAAFLTLRLGEEKSDDYERRSSRRPSEASSFR